MKICVIGNSHVAAIKLAYEALLAETPHEMTFFAGLGRRIERFEVANGVLVPPADDHKIQYAINITSGGLTEVDPALYDSFLIVGMSGGVNRLVSSVTRHLSEGATTCAITDYWHNSRLPCLLKNLRSLTKKPIMVGLAPLLAEAQVNDTTPEAYTRLVTLSNALYFSRFNATLIGQPLDTIVNGDATEIGFSRMSEKLLKGGNELGGLHPEGENSHMNKEYGLLWLQQYFAAL